MDSQASWVAVAMAALAMVGTAISQLNNYMMKRNERQLESDRMTHNSEVAVKAAVMESQMKYQGDRIATLEVELKDCHDKHRQTEERAEQTEERAEKAERRTYELERQVHDLQSVVYGTGTTKGEKQ
jgi:chromosome segregation ATPase